MPFRRPSRRSRGAFLPLCGLIVVMLLLLWRMHSISDPIHALSPRGDEHLLHGGGALAHSGGGHLHNEIIRRPIGSTKREEENDDTLAPEGDDGDEAERRTSKAKATRAQKPSSKTGSGSTKAGKKPVHKKTAPPVVLTEGELRSRIVDTQLAAIADYLDGSAGDAEHHGHHKRVSSLLCNIAASREGNAPPLPRALQAGCVDRLGAHRSNDHALIRVRHDAAEVYNPEAKPGDDTAPATGPQSFVAAVAKTLSEGTKKVMKHAEKMKALAEKTIVSKANPYPDVYALLINAKRKGQNGEATTQPSGAAGKADEDACPLPIATDAAPVPWLDALLREGLPTKERGALTFGVHAVGATYLQEVFNNMMGSFKSPEEKIRLVVDSLKRLFTVAETTVIVLDDRHAKVDNNDYAFLEFLSRALKTEKGRCRVSSVLAGGVAANGTKFVLPRLPEDAAGKLDGSEARTASEDLLLDGVVGLAVHCDGVTESSVTTLYGKCKKLFDMSLLHHVGEYVHLGAKRETMRKASSGDGSSEDVENHTTKPAGNGELPVSCLDASPKTLKLEKAIKFGTKTAIYSGRFHGNRVAVKHFNVAQYATFDGFHSMMRSSLRHPWINYPTSSCVDDEASQSILQIQPFLSSGMNLAHYTKKHAKKGIPWKAKTEIAMQIVCIFQFLHSHPDGWFTFDDNHPEQYFISESKDGVVHVKLVDIDTLQLAEGEAEGVAYTKRNPGSLHIRCRCFYCKGRSNCLFLNSPEAHVECHQTIDNPMAGDHEPPMAKDTARKDLPRKCSGMNDAWFVAELLHYVASGSAPWAHMSLPTALKQFKNGKLPEVGSDDEEYNHLVETLYSTRQMDSEAFLKSLQKLCRKHKCGIDKCPAAIESSTPYSGIFAGIEPEPMGE